MKLTPGIAIGALLYGLAAAGANAADFSAEDREALAAMRHGEMEKLVLHEEPRPAIEATFEDADGNELTLADFTGKLVLLNLWATWCPPCRAEMPSLDRLAGEMAGQDLAVIALSSDRGGAPRIRDFFDEIGVKHLAVHSDRQGGVQRAAGVIGLPVTLLLDREGREIGRVTGDADWDSAETKALIGKLIAVTPPES